MNKVVAFLLCLLLLAAVAVASVDFVEEEEGDILSDSEVELLLDALLSEKGTKEPVSGDSTTLDMNSVKAIMLQKVAIDELNRQRAQCNKKPVVDLKLLSITQQAVKGELYRLTVEIYREQFEIQIIERIKAVHELAPGQENWEESLFIRKITNARGKVVNPCKLRLDDVNEKYEEKKIKVVADVNRNKNATWMATLYDRVFTYGDIPATPSSDRVLKEYISTLSDQAATIPPSYDVRTDPAYAGCKSLLHARDQQSCGSCWSFATTNMLSIRLCKQIQKTSSNPDLANVDLSEQDLVSCSEHPGCSGGNLYTATNAIAANGVRTEMFAPYADSDPTIGGPACQAFGDKRSVYYKSVPETTLYSITKPGATTADKVAIIQREIMKNGPVYASFTVYEDFNSYKGGIYTVQSTESEGSHAVVLVGWGEEAGVKFWTALNSWGPEWGESRGYFRIRRGTDEAGIESTGISVSSIAVPTVSCKNFGAGVFCKNGGERYRNSDGTCGCKCPTSSSGTYCEICAACQNGGTRTAANTMCTCTCPKGTFGDVCDSVFKVTKVVCAADKSMTLSININSGSVKKQDVVVVAWGVSDPVDPASYSSVIPVKTQPCAAGCAATPKTIQLTIPSNPWSYQKSQDYKLYVWKNLGTNEFGASRGYTGVYVQTINRSMCGKTY